MFATCSAGLKAAHVEITIFMCRFHTTSTVIIDRANLDAFEEGRKILALKIFVRSI